MDNRKVEDMQTAIQILEEIKSAIRKCVVAQARLVRKGFADRDIELMSISKMLEPVLDVAVSTYGTILDTLDMDPESYMRDLEKEIEILANTEKERKRYWKHQKKSGSKSDVLEDAFKRIIEIDEGEHFLEYIQDPDHLRGLERETRELILRWYEEETEKTVPEDIRAEVMRGTEQ